jgi:hypothetical protein
MMTLTEEQLIALMQYVRAVASKEAAIATDGSSEGGYDREERACENQLRTLFLAGPITQTH